MPVPPKPIPPELLQSRAPGDDLASITIRVMRALERQMAAVERIAGALNAAPEHAEEAERNGRTLASLSRTLTELNTLIAIKDKKPEPNDDEFPASDEELRRELLRRMEALIAGRSSEIPGESEIV